MICYRLLIVLLGVTVVLWLASCGDDSTTPEATTGSLMGTITDTENDGPVVGAAVLVVTDEFAVVQVVATDAAGAFAMSDLPNGSYLIYALDENFLLVEWHEARIRITNGHTTEADLLMVPSDHTELLTYRIEGRVTDADTGAPLMGAWVLPIGYGEAGNSVRYLTNNSGLVAAVSGADGRYSLPKWPIRNDYPDGPVLGLGAVSCAAGGFRPRTFVGTVPSSPDMEWLETGWLPAPADSVLVLDIALEAIPAGGLPASETGTIRGRIVHDSVPQAEVMVTATLTILADLDTIPDPEKIAVPGGSMLSRADGTFDLHLEPGWYAVRPGMMPDDGWRPGATPMMEVVAGQTIEYGDLGVTPAILPVSPERGAVVPYPLTTLIWTSVPRAERYQIEIQSDRGYYFATATTDTFYGFFEPSGIEPGSAIYRWEVHAMMLMDPPFYTRINSFEVPATFTVTGGSEPLFWPSQ